MNKKTMFFGAFALILSGIALLPQVVSAYKGDPNVQGPNFTEERHEAVTKAFANQDYEAWQAEMSGKGVSRKINAENFAKFAEAHQLALEGKTEEACAIRAELGLGQGNGQGKGQGFGQGNCQR